VSGKKGSNHKPSRTCWGGIREVKMDDQICGGGKTTLQGYPNRSQWWFMRRGRRNGKIPVDYMLKIGEGRGKKTGGYFTRGGVWYDSTEKTRTERHQVGSTWG